MSTTFCPAGMMEKDKSSVAFAFGKLEEGGSFPCLKAKSLVE